MKINNMMILNNRLRMVQDHLDKCDSNCDYCYYRRPIRIGTYPDGEPIYKQSQLGGELYYTCSLEDEIEIIKEYMAALSSR